MLRKALIRILGRFLFHCVKEGAEGKLSAAAVCWTQSGPFRLLWFVIFNASCFFLCTFGGLFLTVHRIIKLQNLFQSCGYSSFLQSRSGEPLRVLRLCLCVTVFQTHTVNHVSLVNVGEDVNHLSHILEKLLI